MGFLAFIIVLAVLSRIFETLEGLAEAMSVYAPFISAFVAGLGGYRFMRRMIAKKKAEQEEARKKAEKENEELERLREKVRRELQEEVENETQEEGSIQRAGKTRQQAKDSAEEPYYPETQYFRR